MSQPDDELGLSDQSNRNNSDDSFTDSCSAEGEDAIELLEREDFDFDAQYDNALVEEGGQRQNLDDPNCEMSDSEQHL